MKSKRRNEKEGELSELLGKQTASVSVLRSPSSKRMPTGRHDVPINSDRVVSTCLGLGGSQGRDAFRCHVTRLTPRGGKEDACPFPSHSDPSGTKSWEHSQKRKPQNRNVFLPVMGDPSPMAPSAPVPSNHRIINPPGQASTKNMQKMEPDRIYESNLYSSQNLF